MAAPAAASAPTKNRPFNTPPNRPPGVTREQARTGLRWLREHNLPTRGHVLAWPGWNNLRKHVRERNGRPQQDGIPALAREPIMDSGPAIRRWVVEWDVLNEPYMNHDLMGLSGREFMFDGFKTGRATMPDVALYCSDFSNHGATTDRGHGQHFEDTTRLFLEHGAPVEIKLP